MLLPIRLVLTRVDAYLFLALSYLRSLYCSGFRPANQSLGNSSCVMAHGPLMPCLPPRG